MRSILAAAVFAALAFGSSPAFAGTCPAGKTGVDVTKPGPMAPAKVTDTVISSVDLANYDAPGRQLRLRRLVIQPGGVVPWHSHDKRPANIYVVSGEVTEYRSTCAVPIVHKTGQVVAESGATAHWWKNTGKATAVLLSADILPPEEKPAASM